MKVIIILSCLFFAVTFGAEEALYGEESTVAPPDENELKKSSDEVDDHVIVDGDILLSKEHADIYYKEGWDGLVKSQAWSPYTRRWGKNIPYLIASNLYGSTRSNTINSINEINRRTCVNLYARRSERNFIYFRRGYGCYTWLGRPSSGYRSIYLSSGCAGSSSRARTPAHEVMHVMGRYHEQTRPDRDRYVTVKSWNTCPSQMRKQTRARTLGIGYDYYSVMHYSRWQCARSWHHPSMTFPRGVNVNYVGQRSALSSKDVQHIKKIHCPSMMTRLVGGEGPYEGRVEVNSDDVWGTVCSNGFDMKDARVVCKYLGHPGVEKMYTTRNNVKYTTKNVPIWMSNLMCTGEEFSPFDCEQAPIATHDCSHNQDVAIKCSKAARLVGNSDNSGRLEIYHEGQWGSVCSHKFGYKEAMVACRMMGYTRAVRAFTADEAGQVTSAENKVILSELKCDGKEDHLSSCDYGPNQSCSQDSPVYLNCR